MDATSRQVMAFHTEDRRRKRATRLWVKLPLVDREEATFDTEQSVVYAGVMPAARHQAMSTVARKTNPIGRVHNTLRQRVSRVVRPTVSFAKKPANHSGAIKISYAIPTSPELQQNMDITPESQREIIASMASQGNGDTTVTRTQSATTPSSAG
jgi:insertion element IS1 protein InsB